jgi:hypothetical protein
MTTKHALLALPLAAGLIGCADGGDIQVVLLNNGIPAANCELGTGGETEFRARGLLNTTSLNAYIFTPIVKSFVMVTPGTMESQRIAFVHGARVSLTMADEAMDTALQASGQAEFTARFSAAIEPDGGTAVVAFDLVPTSMMGQGGTLDAILPPDPATGAGSQATLLAEVRLFGEMGGGEFEADPYTYPITLCRDCAGTTVPYGDCLNVPEGSMFEASNSCNVEQDGVTVCCTSGPALVCPAVREEI